MIRKLTGRDEELTLSFLSEEPSINLFILGDIEAFGFDNEFQEIWGEFDHQGSLIAVLLRFYQSFIPYAKGKFDVDGFVSIIQEYPKPIFLSGKSDIVEKFEQFPELTLGDKKVTYFAECISDELLTLTTSKINIKKAALNDVDDIINLRQTIDEF